MKRKNISLYVATFVAAVPLSGRALIDEEKRSITDEIAAVLSHPINREDKCHLNGADAGGAAGGQKPHIPS